MWSGVEVNIQNEIFSLVDSHCCQNELYLPYSDILLVILCYWRCKLNNLTSIIHYSLGVSSNYILFFLSSCWLFVIHNRLRVLFYSLFHWNGCYSVFLIFRTEIFIIHVLFNPVIHYSASASESYLLCMKQCWRSTLYRSAIEVLNIDDEGLTFVDSHRQNRNIYAAILGLFYLVRMKTCWRSMLQLD